MIFVLSGPDEYSTSQALDDIKRESGTFETLSMSTTTLEGQNLSLNELKNTCETLPFMSGKRLVIVKGLIGRFESQGKSYRPKSTTGKTRKNAKIDEAQLFSDYLAGGVPDTTILVLMEGIISGENPVFQAVSGKAVLRSFTLPKDQELREWVEKKITEENGTISPKALQLLIRLVGNDLWAMANEVNKLVVYTDGKKIDEDDVSMIVSTSQHSNVFNLIDAILELRVEEAEQILQEQFLTGAAPVYLLFMLSRQVQLIVRAGELKKNRVNNHDMQIRLGMRSEWILKKTMDQAGRYSLSRLREIYQSILNADIAIKTGRYEPELALNILVAELCRKSGKKTSVSESGRRL